MHDVQFYELTHYLQPIVQTVQALVVTFLNVPDGQAEQFVKSKGLHTMHPNKH
jgi:hypothetical protein